MMMLGGFDHLHDDLRPSDQALAQITREGVQAFLGILGVEESQESAGTPRVRLEDHGAVSRLRRPGVQSGKRCRLLVYELSDGPLEDGEVHCEDERSAVYYECACACFRRDVRTLDGQDLTHGVLPIAYQD